MRSTSDAAGSPWLLWQTFLNKDGMKGITNFHVYPQACACFFQSLFLLMHLIFLVALGPHRSSRALCTAALVVLPCRITEL